MTIPANGFQESESILKAASTGFLDASQQTRVTMKNLDDFLVQATTHYQGAQAKAFHLLHAALQDEQEIVKQNLDLLQVGAEDSAGTLGVTNQNITDDQMNLLKQVGSNGGGGAIFNGLTR